MWMSETDEMSRLAAVEGWGLQRCNNCCGNGRVAVNAGGGGVMPSFGVLIVLLMGTTFCARLCKGLQMRLPGHLCSIGW